MSGSVRLSVCLSVRPSMGLWYWELMSHPDPAVLPVGTLHSLEWFWVSRRIFIYSHHNTFVFSLRRLSVRPSVFISVRLSVRHTFLAATSSLMNGIFRPPVCHTFLTMFPSSHYHEIFRSYYQWLKWRPCKRSRSEVKGQGHRSTPNLAVSRLYLQF